MSRHSAFVYGVAVTPDGKRVVSVGEDGRVCLWDAHRLDHIKDLGKFDTILYDVTIDQRTGAIAVVGQDRFFRIWRGIDDETPVDLRCEDIGSLNSVRFSSDGSSVAAVGVRGCVVARMHPDADMKPRTIRVGRLCDGIAWLPDDRSIAVGSDQSIRVVDKDENTRSRRIGGIESLIRCIEFDRVNDRLFVAGTNGVVKVWQGKDIFNAK